MSAQGQANGVRQLVEDEDVLPGEPPLERLRMQALCSADEYYARFHQEKRRIPECPTCQARLDRMVGSRAW